MMETCDNQQLVTVIFKTHPSTASTYFGLCFVCPQTVNTDESLCDAGRRNRMRRKATTKLSFPNTSGV